MKLDARGDGIKKIKYEPRLTTSRSAGDREAEVGVVSVTVGELTIGDAADCDGTPMRGELAGALETGAGDGVLQTG